MFAESAISPPDNLMQQIIRDEFRDCIIIAIAHRLDIIIDFDRIAVLHMGQIVECDSPQALLAKDTAFKRLYECDKSSSLVKRWIATVMSATKIVFWMSVSSGSE